MTVLSATDCLKLRLPGFGWPLDRVQSPATPPSFAIRYPDFAVELLYWEVAATLLKSGLRVNFLQLT